MIRQTLQLLQPRWWSLTHGRGDPRRILRSVVFAAMGLGFWAGIYLVSRRLLAYFQQSEDIGDILAYKLLSIVLVTCFSLLVFSVILTTLSKLYLSKDLFPDFASENPAQSVTSFGGMLFMMLASVLIGAVILLEAGPVYRLFMAGIKGKPVSFWLWSWSAAAFFGALAICIAAMVISMRFGETRLKQENAHVP